MLADSISRCFPFSSVSQQLMCSFSPFYSTAYETHVHKPLKRFVSKDNYTHWATVFMTRRRKDLLPHCCWSKKMIEIVFRRTDRSPHRKIFPQRSAKELKYLKQKQSQIIELHTIGGLIIVQAEPLDNHFQNTDSLQQQSYPNDPKHLYKRSWMMRLHR